ncbi:MAG: HEAT repeat domain-containing protein [Deltaproteobacteria bacterium]|nr:HEAT repeat domain-containing protein [Deltaproteobacteria bacterium]
MRAMKTVATRSNGFVWMALAATLAWGFVSAGCDDPNDPKTWAKKLSSLRTRKEALDNLARMDADKAKQALPELRALFEETKDPNHLRAIARLNDPSTVDLFVGQLTYDSDNFENAQVAAGFLGDMKAVQGVAGLSAAAEKPLPIKSQANQVRVASIRALARIKDKGATPALAKILTTSADEQDFLLNKTAALALAEIKDPAAIPALLKGLFMTGRGTQLFQECRLALVGIGEPSIAPLLNLLEGKNADVSKMAKELNFDELSPGVVPYKAAYVLGDFRSPKVVQPLLAILKKTKVGPEHSQALLSLGNTGTPEAVDALIAVLKDGKQEPKLRLAASNALFLAGDRRALPVLFETAKSGYITIEGEKASDLRASAAIDFARLATKAEYDQFKDLFDKETEVQGALGEALDRMQVARECDKDLACYGKALKDPSPARSEKGAVAIGLSGDAKQGIPLLLAGLKPVKTLQQDQFPSHHAMLLALTRLANKTCSECVTKLTELIDADKSSARLPGAVSQLAETQVALAVIQNKN